MIFLQNYFLWYKKGDFKLTVNEEHKDRVFKFLFGNPENKEWTLELYNAINGSNYKNAQDIHFNTIEDAVYLGMKMMYLLLF